MELVDPSCFDGLSEDEKQAQLYLAYYTWAGDSSLLDPDCFLGYPHREEVIYAALHVHGGTTDPECIEGLPPEERELAMYEAVYAAASDDTLTHPECFLSLSPEVREMAFYTALYVIADDVILLSPECFLGASREERRLAIYTAAYQISQEPVNPIPGLNPVIWLRADALELEDDDPVDLWPDSSGNGNDATQASMMQMPLYIPNAIGGRPALRFDGIDDWMPVPITSGVAQYFAVLKSSTATWNSYYGILDSSVSEGHQLHKRWGIMSQGQTHFHVDSLPEGVSKNGVDLVPPFDCGAITSPMVMTVNTSAGGIQAEPRGLFQLQRAFFGSGTLAEIIGFSSIQSPENTALIESYLAQKYSIAI